MTRVVARAPVRVADVGGWTDTWFARRGRVCHLAVGPGAEVTVRMEPGRAGEGTSVDLVALGERRLIVVGTTPCGTDLLLHALDAGLAGCGDAHLRVEVRSAVPPGASLGTSASVLVALLGALDALRGGGRSPAEVARWAHEVETGPAGREAGVQDQWAAAMGGAELLEIDPYPDVRHHPVPLAPDVEQALAERLVTVVFGAHDSSAVHRAVIDALGGGAGPLQAAERAALDRLATSAGDAAAALGAGDLVAWAAVLSEATAVQAELHAELVGPAHRAAIAIAEQHRALGWKVNGAGGSGGSLTVVTTDREATERLEVALAAHDPGWAIVALAPSAGLAIESTSP